MPEEKVVHGLTGSPGRAFCGLPGVPRDWPKNHFWVRPEDAFHINCPGCVEVLRTELKK